MNTASYIVPVVPVQNSALKHETCCKFCKQEGLALLSCTSHLNALESQAEPQQWSLSRRAAQTPSPAGTDPGRGDSVTSGPAAAQTLPENLRPISAPASHTIPVSSRIIGFQQPLMFLKVFTGTLHLMFLWNLNRSKNKSWHTQIPPCPPHSAALQLCPLQVPYLLLYVLYSIPNQCH